MKRPRFFTWRKGKYNMKQQLVRVAAAVPQVHLASPKKNAAEILEIVRQNTDANVILFPELCLTGYTCGDLFNQSLLIDETRSQLLWLAKTIWQETGYKGLIVVGAPVRADQQLFNCAVYLYQGKPVAVLPKINLPNYGEFNEKRWFVPASHRRSDTLRWKTEQGWLEIPFGEDILLADQEENVVIGLDVCEDLWVPAPPSGFACMAGANLILNPSASNETAGKQEYRRQLVNMQSARCCCGYVYVSAGPSESTTDLLFSGHTLICECGEVLAEAMYPKAGNVVNGVLDLERSRNERVGRASFVDISQAPAHRIIHLDENLICTEEQVDEALRLRPLEKLPFVPSDEAKRNVLCADTARIQAMGLAQRLAKTGLKRAVVGLSGGLDSTLAFIAAVQAMEELGRSPRDVLAVSMPCVGTTKRTHSNGAELARLMGAEYREIDIRKAVEQHLDDLSHPRDLYDVTFENTQARERTQILMDLANQEAGLVVGTGDLSELALGWCTYNGDQMSMYAVNASLPKTFIKAMVKWHAEQKPELAPVLLDILDTPVSPELLPVAEDGSMVQKTEDSIGKYDLHDFALYHMMKHGYEPKRIFRMACLAWPEIPEETIRGTLTTFYKRFFSQQFKRSCMPDGVKAGPISLSPRGDWRMPSDADSEVFLDF